MVILKGQILFPCAYKTLFGIDCPICGFQRAFWLLLDGDFIESFKIYPPLLPSLLLMTFFASHLLKNEIVRKKFLLYFSAIVLTIIAINYVVKLTI